MSKVFQFGLAALFVASLSVSADAATIVLLDPDTNDGSFESQYTGSNVTNVGAAVVTADWTVNGDPTTPRSGILGRPNTGTPSSAFDRIAASDLTEDGGGISLFADSSTDEGEVVSVTFNNLLGTNGYNVLQEGDVITYSVDINALENPEGTASTSFVTLGLDFGSGIVGAGTLAATDGYDGRSAGGATPFANDAHQTLTLMHTVTAADVLGGQLMVVGTLTALSGTDGGTNAYIDNFVASVNAVPEPSTIAILALAGISLVGVRTRRRS